MIQQAPVEHRQLRDPVVCYRLTLSSAAAATFQSWHWRSHATRCCLWPRHLHRLWCLYEVIRHQDRRCLHKLPWLKAAEKANYKLALLVYKCRQGAAPSYLELREPVDFEAQCWLCSASSSSPVIRRMRLSTVGDRAFPVAAARVWNSRPQHVTSAQSLPVFCSRLKTHLFRRCFPWLCCCAWEVTSSFSDTLIVFLTYSLYTRIRKAASSLYMWQLAAIRISGWLFLQQSYAKCAVGSVQQVGELFSRWSAS